MANQRIRYDETHMDGILLSVRTYIVGKVAYRIRLDLHSLSYAIVDVRANEPVVMGEAHSLSALKIQAKDALNQLGCLFDDEKRKTE